MSSTTSIHKQQPQGDTLRNVPLLHATAIDKKTQKVAEQTLKKRPLSSGSLAGTFMNLDAANAIDGVDNALIKATKVDKSSVNAPSFAAGALTVALGALQIQSGLHGVKDASQKGDDAGILSGGLQVVRGPADILRGSMRITREGIIVAGQASALSKVMKTLGLISSVGGGISAITMGSICMISLTQTLTISGKLKEKLKNGGESAAFEYLQELLSVTDGDKEKVFTQLMEPKEEPAYRKLGRYVSKKIFGDDESPVDKDLKEALKKAHQGDVAQLINIASKNPAVTLLSNNPDINRALSDTEKKIQQDIEHKLQQVAHTLAPCQIKQLVMDISALYDKALVNEGERKKAIFSRAIGSETQKSMERLMNAGHVNDQEKIAVVQAAQKGLVRNTWLLSLGVLACTVWLGLIVVAQVCTGGIYTIVDLVLGLVVSLIWVGIDGYFLYQDYKEKNALTKDKMVMLLGTLVMAASGAIAAALAKSAINMAVTAALTVGWLGILLYMIYQWKTAPSTEQAPAQQASTGAAGTQGRASSGVA